MNVAADPMQFYVIVGEKLERLEIVLKGKYSEIKELETQTKKNKEIFETEIEFKDNKINDIEEEMRRVNAELHYQKDNKSLLNRLKKILH